MPDPKPCAPFPQASASEEPPAEPPGEGSGSPPPPPPGMSSMGSVDITSRAVSLPMGLPTAGAVFFMAGFLKILVMCFPFSGAG